ncbi:unnamed protein product [Symbiodinium natans]|uniref:Esterase n=1 Tax=Symbiodinium natans TaxID=878477 RepID=A0A812V2I2_9DINO|nr:unnamed protein product [Symbiodinium natans]
MAGILRGVVPYVCGGKPTLQGSVTEHQTEQGVWYFLYTPPRPSTSILYHLHGAGEIFAFVRKEVYWTAAALEQAGKSVHIVAPHDVTKFGMWADGKKVRMATSVMNDVMPHAERGLVIEKRCIQGFSMGGFGAALLGLRRPDLFSGIVSWDGALHSWETLTRNRAFIARDQFDNSEAMFDENSPWKAAEACPNKNMPVLILVGSMPATLEYGRRFHKHLEDSGMQQITLVETGLIHSLQPFLAAHGQQATRFLFGD